VLSSTGFRIHLNIEEFTMSGTAPDQATRSLRTPHSEPPYLCHIQHRLQDPQWLGVLCPWLDLEFGAVFGGHTQHIVHVKLGQLTVIALY